MAQQIDFGSQLLDNIHPQLRVWFDPNTNIYYRGKAGDVIRADFIGKRKLSNGKYRLAEVESKYLKAAEHVLRGGIFDTPHSATIKSVVVLDEVLGTMFPEYRIREAYKAVPSPELVLSVDLATTFSAQKRVLPLMSATKQNQTYVRTTWDLAATGKNVASVLLSDEAVKQAVHPALKLHTDNAARTLKKAENEQLVVVMETATDVSGADFGSMNTNGDFSANNPLDIIRAPIVTLMNNGFNPDAIVWHPQTMIDFMSNTFVHNTVIDQALQRSPAKLMLPGLPPLDVITDAGKTNTIATVLSKSGGALILADGPTEAAQYRDEDRGADGYVIRQWTEGKLVATGAIRDITSVSA